MVNNNRCFLLLLLGVWLATSQAFAPVKTSHANAVVLPRAQSVALGMSAEIGNNDNETGETERLLLEAAERRNLGLKQDFGQTIKGDGLDGLRALVWGLFDVSQVVFGCLGVALSLGLLLNVMGYGYFFDWDTGGVVIDTLDHIRQDKVMAAEAAKLAAETAQKVHSSAF